MEPRPRTAAYAHREHAIWSRPYLRRERRAGIEGGARAAPVRPPHVEQRHDAVREASLQYGADGVAVDRSHSRPVDHNSQGGRRGEATCGSAIANRDERHGLRRRSLRLRSNEVQLPAAAFWKRLCRRECGGTEEPSDSSSPDSHRAHHACIVARPDTPRSLLECAMRSSRPRGRRPLAAGPERGTV